MAAIHFVGITLCCGLMLEGIWMKKIQPYFPLFWFVTVWYCLSFGGTLVFLRAYSDPFAVARWLGGLIVLGFLVDSATFFALATSGVGLAAASWYLFTGALPPLVSGALGINGVYLLLVVAISILVINRNRQAYHEKRLNWNRTASSMLSHDVGTEVVGILNGSGMLLQMTCKEKVPMKHANQEEGYWFAKERIDVLQEKSKVMIEAAQDAGKEFIYFSKFIKEQVIGIFDRSKIDMRDLVERVTQKVNNRSSAVRIDVNMVKDFSAHLLPIFHNVLINLINNARTHGKADQVQITVDGDKRTLTVRDNGNGIPAHVLPRIFDLNFSTADGKRGHSGIGLAFVKIMLEISYGKIHCNSRHGDKNSFTEFVMEFPEEQEGKLPKA